MTDTFWTTNSVERLTKLWADGLSASEIAAELGGISRNSVIGKVHRLGLPGRPRPPAGTVPRRRKPRSRGATMRIVPPTIRGNTALATTHAFEPERGPEPEVVEPEPEAQFYTVQPGDSLSKIAKQFYGNAMKYPVIFDANKPMLKDPNKIYPGQVLRIPPLEQ